MATCSPADKRANLLASRSKWSHVCVSQETSDDSGDSRQDSVCHWLITACSDDVPPTRSQEPAVCLGRGASAEDDLLLGVEASLYVRQTSGRSVQEFLRSHGSHVKPSLSRWSSFTSTATLSVMDVLNLWHDDPEELLLDLGFGCDEPDIAVKIPSRFINHPSRARGISIQVFLEAQKNRMDVENPELGDRFRQLEVLQQVTTAFSSLVSNPPVAPSSSPSPCPSTSADTPSTEARERRKRLGMLLRRASRRAIANQARAGSKADSNTLTPLAEEQKHQLDSSTAPPPPHHHPVAQSLLLRKSGPGHGPEPESFEMEEVQSLDEGSMTGNTHSQVSAVARTNSCQSDSSGFLEDPFIPCLPQHSSPVPELIKALHAKPGDSTETQVPLDTSMKSHILSNPAVDTSEETDRLNSHTDRQESRTGDKLPTLDETTKTSQNVSETEAEQKNPVLQGVQLNRDTMDSVPPPASLRSVSVQMPSCLSSLSQSSSSRKLMLQNPCSSDHDLLHCSDSAETLSSPQYSDLTETLSSSQCLNSAKTFSFPIPSDSAETLTCPCPADSAEIHSCLRHTDSAETLSCPCPSDSAETPSCPCPSDSAETPSCPCPSDSAEIHSCLRHTDSAETPSCPWPSDSAETLSCARHTDSAEILSHLRHTDSAETLFCPCPSDSAETLSCPRHTDSAETLSCPCPSDSAETLCCPCPSDSAEILSCPCPSDSAEILSCPCPSDSAETLSCPCCSDSAETLSCPRQTDSAEALSSPCPSDSAETLSCPCPSDSAETLSCPCCSDSAETLSCPRQTDSAEALSSPCPSDSAETLSCPCPSDSAETLSCPCCSDSAETLSCPRQTDSAEALSSPCPSDSAETLSCPRHSDLGKMVSSLQWSATSPRLRRSDSAEASSSHYLDSTETVSCPHRELWCRAGGDGSYRTRSISLDTGLAHEEEEEDEEEERDICCCRCQHRCSCCPPQVLHRHCKRRLRHSTGLELKHQQPPAFPYSMDELDGMMRCTRMFQTVLADIEERLGEEQAQLYYQLSSEEREDLRDVQELRAAVRKEAVELEMQLADLAHHYDQSFKMKLHRLLDEQSYLCAQLRLRPHGTHTWNSSMSLASTHSISSAHSRSVSTQCSLPRTGEE